VAAAALWLPGYNKGKKGARGRFLNTFFAFHISPGAHMTRDVRAAAFILKYARTRF
jgi:hypothetical protein